MAAAGAASGAAAAAAAGAGAAPRAPPPLLDAPDEPLDVCDGRGIGDGVCVDEPSFEPSARDSAAVAGAAAAGAAAAPGGGGGGVFAPASPSSAAARSAAAAAAAAPPAGRTSHACNRRADGDEPSGSDVVSACEPAALAETHATPYSAHSICSCAAPKCSGVAAVEAGAAESNGAILGRPRRSSSAASDESAPAANCSAVAIQRRSGSGQAVVGRRAIVREPHDLVEFVAAFVLAHLALRGSSAAPRLF